jgi:hypothetical protein
LRLPIAEHHFSIDRRTAHRVCVSFYMLFLFIYHHSAATALYQKIVIVKNVEKLKIEKKWESLGERIIIFHRISAHYCAMLVNRVTSYTISYKMCKKMKSIFIYFEEAPTPRDSLSMFHITCFVKAYHTFMSVCVVVILYSNFYLFSSHSQSLHCTHKEHREQCKES